jgi:squalene synthase HpnC
MTAPPSLRSTPDTDAVLAQASSENFPVASRLLPRSVRADLMALYGFARLVDDTGDEAEGDRHALLDALERDLERIYDGGAPESPHMTALVPAVRAHRIPIDPFRRLIEANRRDQHVHRYETFEDLIGYCRLSADPVGELVLYVFDAATPDRLSLSASVCSGLQVAEHLQDVVEDLRRGRIYLPASDMRSCGVAEDDLVLSPAPGPVRDLIRLEAQRAERMLRDGLPLTRTLPLRPGLAVRAFVGGGLSALGAIRKAGYDVSTGPPRPSKIERTRIFIRIGKS